MSASEMPGATTARLAEPCWPMPWKRAEELDRLAPHAAELPRLLHDEGPARDRKDEQDREDDLGDGARIPDERENAGVQGVGASHRRSFGLRSSYRAIITMDVARAVV